MNREEIEKLIEETARKERSKRKGVSVKSTQHIERSLYAMCRAILSLILYCLAGQPAGRHGRYRCRHVLQNH